MIRKKELWERVVRLRKAGFSYGEIAKKVPVGKGTISNWCREIVLTPTQTKRLQQNWENGYLIKTRREEMLSSRLDAAHWAERVTRLIDLEGLEALTLMGAMLYWGEGTKLRKEGGSDVSITNTDPGIICVSMEFFRKVMEIPEPRFRVTVRIGRKGDADRAKVFWSGVTGVPISQFDKTEFLDLSEQSKSLLKYPHGMCRVSIHSIDMARKLDMLLKELYKILKTAKVIRNDSSESRSRSSIGSEQFRPKEEIRGSSPLEGT
jgi:hypothetical protein